MAKFIGAFFAIFHFENAKNFTCVYRDLCTPLSELLRSPTCQFLLSNRFKHKLAASGNTSVPYHTLITIKTCLVIVIQNLDFYNVCDKLITEMMEATKCAHGISKNLFHFNGRKSKLMFRRSRNWLKPTINCEVRGRLGEMRNAHRVLGGKLKGGECVEWLSLKGKIILKPSRSLKSMGFLWGAERLGFVRRRQQDEGQNLFLYRYFCKLLLGCTSKVLQYTPVAASRK